MSTSSIFLIGMPGAGKSTLGVLLAKALAKPYLDTDLLIQQRAGMTLQAYLDAHGYMALRQLEEEVLLGCDFAGSVVATGGSVVYSEKGMERLGRIGERVYLKISCSTMLSRVSNASERGLACMSGMSLEDLFEERFSLYQQFSDKTVELDNLSFDQSLNTVLSVLSCD